MASDDEVSTLKDSVIVLLQIDIVRTLPKQTKSPDSFHYRGFLLAI